MISRFFRQKRRNIVYTHWADDDPPRYAQFCQSRICDYADRIGVDYRHITGVPSPKMHGAWGKINVLEAFLDSRYDRMLYLDSDVVVSLEAPDVFEEHSGARAFMRRDTLVEYRYAREFENWALEVLGVDVPCQPYFNTGVILMDRLFASEWLALITQWPPRHHAGTYEQHQFNAALKTTILDRSVGCLTKKWNWLNVNQTEASRQETRYFDHFASREGKVILKRELKRYDTTEHAPILGLR